MMAEFFFPCGKLKCFRLSVQIQPKCPGSKVLTTESRMFGDVKGLTFSDHLFQQKENMK